MNHGKFGRDGESRCHYQDYQDYVADNVHNGVYLRQWAPHFLALSSQGTWVLGHVPACLP